MGKYYIRVTDEVPDESERALWVEVDDLNSLYILDKNEYVNLRDTFRNIEGNLKEGYISGLVQDELRSKLDDPQFSVENSEKAYKLTDVNNKNKSYTYSDITSKLSKKADKTTVDTNISAINQNIGELQENVTSLSNSKSDKTHTHTGWKKVVDIGDGILKVYVNESIKLAFLKYYRQDANFGVAGKSYTQSQKIPDPYKPKVGHSGSCFNYNMGAYISNEGEINVWSSKKGVVAINIHSMYYY